MLMPQKSHSMNIANNTRSPNRPQKFKIVVEAPAASFVREFATIKAMTQYKRRNPNMQAISYTLHNGNWERFVIHGSQLIPESVLRSLLNSLNEAPQPSSTNQLPHSPIN